MSRTFTTHWEVGDRVYLVADEQLTGTVVACAGGGIVETLAGRMHESGRYCRVKWDHQPVTDASWYADADLECYTRPAVDEYETRSARLVSSSVVPYDGIEGLSTLVEVWE